MVAVLLLLFAGWQYVISIHDFLQVNKPVANAQVLIVEGWMPDVCLQQAYEEYSSNKYKLIITTGGATPDEFVMTDKSSMVYDFSEQALPPKKNTNIQILARGTKCDKVYPHMNVYVNNELVGSTFVSKHVQAYELKLDEAVLIDDLKLEYTNDGFNETEDRNLIVESVQVNEHVYSARSHLVTIDYGYKQVKTYYYNYADKAAAYMMNLGLTSKELLALPTECATGSKTVASARTVAQWFSKHPDKYESANLMSMGVHAKRSQLVFEDNLPSFLNLGIVSTNHPAYNPKIWWRTAKGITSVAKETIGYIYFSIFE